MVITENGIALADEIDADGRIRDARRRDYIYRHLAAAHRALGAGVPLTGYFHWSLIDNFEWARGYDARFGLVHVDFATQVRTPKESARWYGAVARANAMPDDGEDEAGAEEIPSAF